ncbi:HTH domain-containing protein [Gracilibacillus orientalis]|uniref:HTH domain-containing protein n=1 Tax=Gracilibacillus orientalis TaxID=334253 RepID=A0A1I4LU23_9BACI|nr:BglG family transcription antiterminator [Gracilibacillus orientalis]SFL94500.1 HTH domain-containing protein [Gracilibacillus orientalis]
MRKRQQILLRKLLLADGQVTLVQNLAEELDCSEKTIRNDLQVVESFLEEQSNGQLIRKPGVGVSVEISEDEKQNILSLMQTDNNVKRNVLGVVEQKEILYRLLIHENISIQQLTDRYFVSHTTIKKVIEEMETWLKTRNVQIQTKQKVGIVVKAAEKDIRIAIQQIDYFKEKKDSSSFSFVYQQVQEHERRALDQSLLTFISHYQIPLTDESIKSLKIYMIVMMKRLKTNHIIEISKDRVSFITKKQEFQWIEKLVEELEDIFLIKVPDHEKVYLTMQFLGAKFQERHEDVSASVDKQAEWIAEVLTKRLSVLALMPFGNDETLKEGLKVHLYSVLNRLTYELPVQNPLASDIKQMYPFMFDALITALQDMEEELPFKIPEDEVAFLTLHYQASVERIRGERQLNKKIVIVCHMGIGVSEILRSKIATSFHETDIIAILPQNKLQTFLKERSVDLIVSTVPLDDIVIPHVTVTPLFNENDKNKLRNVLKGKVESQGVSDSILKSYLKENYIFLHLDIEHRFELIEKLSERLVHDGLVETDYGHQALIRERAAATAIGGGIAIPHGDPNLVRESTIVVVTLKEPIIWGTESVSLIFFLVLKQESSDKRRRLFHQLSRLAGNPEKVAKVTGVTDIDEFLAIMD